MKRKLILLSGIFLVSICIIFILLNIIFPFPQEWLVYNNESKRILDSNNKILMQFLNSKDQWQLCVPLSQISPHFLQAIIATEDKNFYSHCGIDFLAIIRSFIGNITRTKRYSGASTITTQCIKQITNRPRTITTKIYEAFRAWQLERIWSKDKILEFYCNYTPYGGNLIGVEAASLRYFNKHASQLSLSEALLLAGLPQSPNRYRPDKNYHLAIQRQYYVAYRMRIEGYITKKQVDEIKNNPPKLHLNVRSFLAAHFCMHAYSKQHEPTLYSTLDSSLQEYSYKVLTENLSQYISQKIDHGAILIVDNTTGKILTWIGSANFFASDGQIDAVRSKRSPGSLLKTFTYLYALENGLISPEIMLVDLPILHSNYTPQNYNYTYQGLITARQALRQSLNIPAVLLQKKIGTKKLLDFYHLLGLTSLKKKPEEYGLSLTLGGGEVTLLELVQAYSTIARLGNYIPLSYDQKDNNNNRTQQIISPEASYLITDILKDTKQLEAYLSINCPPFAWKTGTSSHHKDAWTILYNPLYTVGVWLGNFNGKNSCHLVGATSAAPIACKIFQYLMLNKQNIWYDSPSNVAIRKVCRVSGELPNPKYCKDQVEELYIVNKSPKNICKVHTEVTIDRQTKYKVCPFCKTINEENYICESWPIQVHYWLEQQNYQNLMPKHNPKCPYASSNSKVQIITPKHKNIYILLEKNTVALNLQANSSMNKTLYWFDHKKLIGTTYNNEKLQYNFTAGKHTIVCIDEAGGNDTIEIFVNNQ